MIQTDKERIEKQAVLYCEGSSEFLFEYRGYIAGATAEHERLQQQLKEKEERDKKAVAHIINLEGDVLELKDELKSAQDLNRELVDGISSLLRLKHILTYEENIPPEHEGEAIAINNAIYKLEHLINKAQ